MPTAGTRHQRRPSIKETNYLLKLGLKERAIVAQLIPICPFGKIIEDEKISRLMRIRCVQRFPMPIGSRLLNPRPLRYRFLVSDTQPYASSVK